MVFARKLDAKAGTVGTVVTPLTEEALAVQIGEDDVETDELRVDVLYADDIRAKEVEIRQAHIVDLKIRERGGDGDD